MHRPRDWGALSAHLALLCVLGVLEPAVLAHDLARSESRLEVRGSTVQCQLIVDLLEFPGVDQDGNGTISYSELDRTIADVFARVKEHLVLGAPGPPAKVVLTRHDLVDEHTARLDLTYTFPGRISRLDVTSTFDVLARRPDHQHYVTLTMGGEEERAVLDASRRTVTFEHQWWTRTSLWITLAALAIVGLRIAWYWRARRIRR
jgi:hypothetical protein